MYQQILSSILIFISISIFLALFSFHPEDPGWGVVSDNISKNFYGEIGSFFSGFMISEFGILPGLFISSIVFEGTTDRKKTKAGIEEAKMRSAKNLRSIFR